MPPTADELAAALAAEAGHDLADALGRIEHCLRQRSDEQTWWRPGEAQNGHTQEVVHITRVLLGDAYQFAWEPATPEQGAP